MSNEPLSVNLALIKAKTLVKKGELNQAMEFYRAVLEKFPRNKRAIEGLKSLTRPKHNQGQSVLNIEPSREQIDGLTGQGFALVNGDGSEETRSEELQPQE